jgi:hypothetical protein
MKKPAAVCGALIGGQRMRMIRLKHPASNENGRVLFTIEQTFASFSRFYRCARMGTHSLRLAI